MSPVGGYAEQAFGGRSYAQGLFEVSAVQKHPIGFIRPLADGRKFVYCKAGGVQLAAGVLCQAAAMVANDTNRAITVQAEIGDRIVKVTLGGATTANLYRDGYMIFNDCGAGTGEAYVYKIKNHPAGTSNVPFTLYDAIRIQSTTAAEITLVKHPNDGVLIHPSPPTQALVGVTTNVVPIGNYYWSQVCGPAAVLVEGTLVIGKTCVPSVTTDGAVAPPALTEGTPNTGFDQQICGSVLTIAASTEYALINLAIPGY